MAASIGTFSGAVGCKDSRGNTYTVDGRASANNLFVCSAHVATALQPGDTITLTYPAFSGASAAVAFEFAGIKATSPVDGTFRTGSSTSTKVVSVSPPLTTTNASDVLFGAVGSTGVFVSGNGFTLAGTRSGATGVFRVVASPGTFGVLGSVGTGAWRALLIAYRVG
jgi:hypothetical protein